MNACNTDPIADMLTRIRNANTALAEVTKMPVSKQKLEIARILLDEGYIASYRVDKAEPVDLLVVELKYGSNRERVISGPEARLEAGPPHLRIQGPSAARARRARLRDHLHLERRVHRRGCRQARHRRRSARVRVVTS